MRYTSMLWQLILPSRSGARVCCQFSAFRRRLPASPCESRDENYILRSAVSSTTKLHEARRDEKRVHDQHLFLHLLAGSSGRATVCFENLTFNFIF